MGEAARPREPTEPLRLVPRACAVVALLIAGMAIAGWIGDVPALSGAVGRLLPMKPSTAACVLVGGLGLWLSMSPRGLLRRMSRACGVVMIGAGLWALGAFMVGGGRAVSMGPILGPVALPAACIVALLGLALVVEDRRRSQRLALMALVITFPILVGFAFGVEFFSGTLSSAPMGLNATIAFLLLGLGVLLSKPGGGWVEVVTGPGPISRQLRQLVPVVIVGWTLIYALRLDGERAGLYGPAFGAALMTSMGVMITLALLWVNSKSAQQALDQSQRLERTEEALRQTNERFRIMVEGVMDYAIFLVDPAGNVASWNQGAQHIKGYSAEEIIGKPISVFYPPEELVCDWPRRLLGQVAQVGHAEEEGWRVRKDGSRFWANVVITALRDDQGQLTGYVKIVRDLTERKRAEDELARQRDLTERIIGWAPAGIAYLDRDLIYRWVNPALARALEIPAEELIGHYFPGLFGPGAEAQLGPAIRGVLETGQPFSATGLPLILEREGKQRTSYWDFTYQPMRREGEQVDGVLILAAEVSERVERERLQRERIASLEQAERMKDEFLSVMSHELRTPLNFIMGFASLLDDELAGPLNELQHGYLLKVNQGVVRMVGIIENLLDASRIAAGKFEVAPSPTAFEVLVHEAVSAFLPWASDRHLKLTSDLEDAGEICVDGRRIIQVLSNLLDNAIKFTPDEGCIQVRVYRKDGKLITEVRDTGIGIAQEDLPRLFRPFSQLDMSSTRTSGGTGLGLSLSKTIIEAHGGRIGVLTELGKGSTFWFSLPGDASCPIPLSVLLVEAEPETRALAQNLLAQSGQHVTTAIDGAEAVRLCLEEGRHFDVIFMEVQSPVLDGLEATRLLRGCPGGKDALIVLLSSQSTRAIREAGRQAGANAFLEKPYLSQELFQVLAAARGPRDEA